MIIGNLKGPEMSFGENYYGGWIGRDHMDSKSMQPGATPGLSASFLMIERLEQ